MQLSFWNPSLSSLCKLVELSAYISWVCSLSHINKWHLCSVIAGIAVWLILWFVLRLSWWNACHSSDESNMEAITSSISYMYLLLYANYAQCNCACSFAKMYNVYVCVCTCIRAHVCNMLYLTMLEWLAQVFCWQRPQTDSRSGHSSDSPWPDVF